MGISEVVRKCLDMPGYKAAVYSATYHQSQHAFRQVQSELYRAGTTAFVVRVTEQRFELHNGSTIQMLSGDAERARGMEIHGVGYSENTHLDDRARDLLEERVAVSRHWSTNPETRAKTPSYDPRPKSLFVYPMMSSLAKQKEDEMLKKKNTDPNKAWVKIPGLHPKAENALQLLSEEDLDKLEERIKSARVKIKEQQKAESFPKGTRVRGIYTQTEYVVIGTRPDGHPTLLVTKQGSTYGPGVGLVTWERRELLEKIA